MNISQRAATLDDLEWLELFYESIMRPYVELTHEWDSTKFRAHFDPKIIKVIQANAVDIGMLKVEVRDDCIYLGDIQIDRAYQNQGIGTKLIETVIRSAIIANKPIRLRVLKGNPAKNLYLRLGFQEIQTFDNAYILELHINDFSRFSSSDVGEIINYQPGDIVELKSMNLTVPIEPIYDDIVFNPEE